jgi:enoyl-CoA hydratase/carnithine racemase
MSLVSVDQRDGVTVVTVDHPPANAMNLELLASLVAALGALAAAPPRAVVVAGREGCFSAGVDLKEAPGYDAGQQRQMIVSINDMALTLYALECPVVAAITGHAIAGGMVLALGADVRIASSVGRYGLTEVKVGVAYPQAAIGLARAELAPHVARILALRSELVDAQTCQALGVFDEVVSPDAVVPRALEVAGQLAAFDAATYARTKRDLRGATLESLRAAAASDPLLEQWL